MSFISIVVESFVQAQQVPLHVLCFKNPVLFDPVYAGSNQKRQSIAGYRIQWAGFDVNPITFNFSSNLSIAPTITTSPFQEPI